MKYAWIRSQRDQYPVRLLCDVAGVSASGYYGWMNAADKPQAKREEALRKAVRFYHQRSNRVYGYRKVHTDLVEEAGLSCCLETVRRIMQSEGLRSRVLRKHRYPATGERFAFAAENLLAREFVASEPNRKWAADITYLRTDEGWLYLAVVLDLFSRRVVGWSMSERADAQLACRALKSALRQRRPGSGLLHHSDQGCQYTSGAFSTELDRHGIVCSMSRRGNCWDNAVTESFFGKLKREWVRGKRYRTRQEARQDVFLYLEVFYNRKRRHAFLGYQSPEAFERQYHQTNQKLAA